MVKKHLNQCFFLLIYKKYDLMVLDFNFWKQYMLKKICKAYKKFFDEKLWNGTTVVSLIAILIVLIAWCTPNAHYIKANALEVTSFVQHDDMITIGWKTFKVLFQEVK